MSTMFFFFCEGNRVVLTAAPVVFIKPLYIIKWLQIFLLSPPPRHVYHKKGEKKGTDRRNQNRKETAKKIKHKLGSVLCIMFAGLYL